MFDFYVDGVYQDELKKEIGTAEQRTNENVIRKEDTINEALNKFDGEMGESLICTAWQDFTPSGVNYILTQDENATNPYDITQDISKVDGSLNRFIVVKDDDSKSPVRASGILNAFTYVKVVGYDEITGETTLNYEPKSNFRILYKYTFPKYEVPNGKLFGGSISQNVADGDSSDQATEIQYDNTTSGLTSEDVQEAIDEINDNSTYSAGTGLGLSGNTFNIDNPFNPSGTYSGLRAQATTYGDVGAAPASHSHSYLPLSGGTITGGLLQIGQDGVGQDNELKMWADNGYEAKLVTFETPTHGMGLRYNATDNIMYIDRYPNTTTPDPLAEFYRDESKINFTASSVKVSNTLTLGNFSTTERDALSLGSTDEGKVIFNTTTKKFQGWDGTSWVDFHGYGS